MEETGTALYSCYMTADLLKEAPGAKPEEWQEGGTRYQGYSVSGADALLAMSANIADNLEEADRLSASGDPEDRQDAARLKAECIEKLGELQKLVESTPLGKLGLIGYKVGTSAAAE